MSNEDPKIKMFYICDEKDALNTEQRNELLKEIFKEPLKQLEKK